MSNADDLNRTVFISDNLPFLRSLDTESVDLVCIDPPFGKNQTFEGKLKPALTSEEQRIESEMMAEWGAYDSATAYEMGLEWPDQAGKSAKFRDIWSFQRLFSEGWLEQLQQEFQAGWWLIQATRYSHGESTAAYIGFMLERMLEIHRVLKPTGSVYLHCDHEANAYLRQLMDAIFGNGENGSAGFRNEMVWQRTKGRSDGNQYGRVHDNLLFYTKSHKWTWNKPYLPHEPAYVKSTYRNEDSLGRWQTSDLTASGPRDGQSGQPWRGADPNSVNRHWSTPTQGGMNDFIIENNLIPGWPEEFPNVHDRLEALDKAGLIHWPKGGKGMPNLKRYLQSTKGAAACDIILDIPRLQTSDPERTGYPTQKPQALARRLIEASSNPGDLVLDCFAGCAYVPVAAEQTGRRWIACDMSPRAWTVVRRQFHKQPDLRIATEGELAEGIQVQLGETRMIAVRGPFALPVRTKSDDTGKQVRMRVKDLPPVSYKQKPVESSKDIWEAFVDRYGPECWYCGRIRERDRREIHLDHVEPDRRDGTNDDCWNRALACSPCNSDKSNNPNVDLVFRKAVNDGRISSEAKMGELKRTFVERRKWAQQRWEAIRVKMA